MSICRHILFSQFYRTTCRTPQDPTNFWISALKNISTFVSTGSKQMFKLGKWLITVSKILCAQDFSIYRLQITELSWLETKTERKHSSSCSICWAFSSLSIIAATRQWDNEAIVCVPSPILWAHQAVQCSWHIQRTGCSEILRET